MPPLNYNLIGEVISMFVILVVSLSFFSDYQLESIRVKTLKRMYFSVVLLSLTTIASTYLAANPSLLPLWILELTTVLYYCLLPVASFSCCYFIASINRAEENHHLPLKKFKTLFITYIIYILFVIANYFFNHLFTVSATIGYSRELLFFAPYLVTLFYLSSMFYYAYKNRFFIKQRIILTLAVNTALCVSMLVLQLFNSNLVFSGIASACGVLTMHLYIHNGSKARDNKTRLLNDVAFAYYITKNIKKNNKFSALTISLRDMKSLNNKFGRDVGDKLLENISAYIKTVYPKQKTVFRSKGDEFSIITQESPSLTEVKFRKIMKRFDFPFLIDDRPITINAAFARVDYPEFTSNNTELMSALEFCISKLKRSSSLSQYMYDKSSVDELRINENIKDVVKNSIKNDNFELYYQPIYNAKMKAFTHAEALFRVKDESGAYLRTDLVIDIVEKTGLIIPLTYKIIEHVCKDIRSGLKNIFKSISINVPFGLFLETDMLTKINMILATYSVSPPQIKMEITERTLITNSVQAQKTMKEMIASGYSFMLDDFGMDYSNINVFLTLPVQYVKLDRSLVLAGAESEKFNLFLTGLIKSILALDKDIVVEGIEDHATAKKFISVGCNFLQGYHYFKPSSAEELKEYFSPQLIAKN